MIRDLTTEDLDRLKEIHEAQGYTFLLPDLTNPLMVVRKVVVSEANVITMAMLGELHISALLLVDGKIGTPQERLQNVMELQKVGFTEADKLGLTVATTQMEGRFAERMEQMGWVKGWGQMFYHSIP